MFSSFLPDQRSVTVKLTGGFGSKARTWIREKQVPSARYPICKMLLSSKLGCPMSLMRLAAERIWLARLVDDQGASAEKTSWLPRSPAKDSQGERGNDGLIRRGHAGSNQPGECTLTCAKAPNWRHSSRARALMRTYTSENHPQPNGAPGTYPDTFPGPFPNQFRMYFPVGHFPFRTIDCEISGNSRPESTSQLVARPPDVADAAVGKGSPWPAG